MSLKIWPKNLNYRKAITIFDVSYNMRNPSSTQFDYLLTKVSKSVMKLKFKLIKKCLKG